MGLDAAARMSTTDEAANRIENLLDSAWLLQVRWLRNLHPRGRRKAASRGNAGHSTEGSPS